MPLTVLRRDKADKSIISTYPVHFWLSQFSSKHVFSLDIVSIGPAKVVIVTCFVVIGDQGDAF